MSYFLSPGVHPAAGARHAVPRQKCSRQRTVHHVFRWLLCFSHHEASQQGYWKEGETRLLEGR